MQGSNLHLLHCRQILYHLSHWGNLKQDGRSLTLSLFDSPRSSEHQSFQEHLPCGSAGKESTCNVGDLGLIPGLGRFPGEGNVYPLQYPGLENSMVCIVHGGHKESDTTE